MRPTGSWSLRKDHTLQTLFHTAVQRFNFHVSTSYDFKLVNWLIVIIITIIITITIIIIIIEIIVNRH